MCGKHGECVNNLEGFKCSCSFFFTGVVCEKCEMNFLVFTTIKVIVLLISSCRSGATNDNRWDYYYYSLVALINLESLLR
jgi:hypothetical protein